MNDQNLPGTVFAVRIRETDWRSIEMSYSLISGRRG